MARPTTLPGIWGALAVLLGVGGLANALGTNTRTLNNWAKGLTALPAVASGRLANLCNVHGVAPLIFTHPNIANGYVASTPEGWVVWVWGLPSYGYDARRRYIGHISGLVPATPEELCMARTHGWPW